MGMILPLLYLGVGFGLATLLPEHWGNHLKESASALLTCWIIPTVIVYIVATSRPELFFMAASTMVLMALLVRCSGFFTNDPVQRLALVYLNAGIFGIPVVASFWGEEAVRLYVGAYIGNSVMGNILGTSLMRRETNTDGLTTSRTKPTQKAAVSAVLRSLLTNRPIVAVAIGLICMPHRTVSQHPRRRYLPAHHLGLQLRRAHGARHVAEHRPTAPNRPKTSPRVGSTSCCARERLQCRHTNRCILDAHAYRSAPRSATGTPAGTFYPRSATASR